MMADQLDFVHFVSALWRPESHVMIGSELFAYRLPQVISKKAASRCAGLILSRYRSVGKWIKSS